MNEHQVQWIAPSPLWQGLAIGATLEERRAINNPAILRFAADSFMEDFLKIMETDPATLPSLVVEAETWREPMHASAKISALLEPAEPVSSFARKINRLRLIAERSRNGTGLSGLLNGGTPQVTQRSLKLYQPAHQRFYLVSACLVCGITGMPDHALDVARQERATFVVRRLFPANEPDRKTPLPAPDSTWDEYAMVITQTGAGWQKVAKINGSTPAVAIAGEEQLPLFPVNYAEDDGRRRRLFTGLVPIGKREVYMGTSRRRLATEPPQTEKKIDPRMMLVWTQVTEPWKRLVERARTAKQMQTGQSTNPPSADLPLNTNPAALARSIKDTREQIQTVSWLVLLDFAKLLKQYIPNVWNKLIGQSITLDPNKETPLYDALTATTIDQAYADDLILNSDYANANVVLRSLSAALVAIKKGTPANPQTEEQIENNLESVIAPYDRFPTPPATRDPKWPTFLFPLADSVKSGPLPPAASGVIDDPDNKIADALARLDRLASLIENALPEQTTEPLPSVAMAAQPPFDPREGWFVMRCVFERPNCGPLEPPVVSAPTREFQMAGFFDPDAPARPIRIALPVDTTPAGLRKFDKNTAFMISDMLCGQIDRMKGLSLGDLIRSVLPWPLHKDLSVPDTGPCTDKNDPSLQAGMICSLSIPIITICALLLLMIIVSLLDLIFRWIPYFIICFPLPGFKAKK
jgi:hypothetical protein